MSIAAISDAHNLSRNHIMKVVHQLGLAGFITTVRGKGGGFTLARPASDIRIGDVVRITEPDLRPAECENCLLQPACGLSPVLGEAVNAFLAVLDRYSVADAVARKPDIRALVGRMMMGGED
jgi:Rrf2 family nitric oxide-sensitive transcriptional repressor